MIEFRGYTPMARTETCRLVGSLASARGWSMFLLDLKLAFLNGPIKEMILICTRCKFGYVVYMQATTSSMILICLHIYDLLVIGSNVAGISVGKGRIRLSYLFNGIKTDIISISNH